MPTHSETIKNRLGGVKLKTKAHWTRMSEVKGQLNFPHPLHTTQNRDIFSEFTANTSLRCAWTWMNFHLIIFPQSGQLSSPCLSAFRCMSLLPIHRQVRSLPVPQLPSRPAHSLDLPPLYGFYYAAKNVNLYRYIFTMDNKMTRSQRVYPEDLYTTLFNIGLCDKIHDIASLFLN